jgi:hypothetical protein
MNKIDYTNYRTTVTQTHEKKKLAQTTVQGDQRKHQNPTPHNRSPLPEIPETFTVSSSPNLKAIFKIIYVL